MQLVNLIRKKERKLDKEEKGKRDNSRKAAFQYEKEIQKKVFICSW